VDRVHIHCKELLLVPHVLLGLDEHQQAKLQRDALLDITRPQVDRLHALNVQLEVFVPIQQQAHQAVLLELTLLLGLLLVFHAHLANLVLVSLLLVTVTLESTHLKELEPALIVLLTHTVQTRIQLIVVLKDLTLLSELQLVLHVKSDTTVLKGSGTFVPIQHMLMTQE